MTVQIGVKLLRNGILNVDPMSPAAISFVKRNAPEYEGLVMTTSSSWDRFLRKDTTSAPWAVPDASIQDWAGELSSVLSGRFPSTVFQVAPLREEHVQLRACYEHSVFRSGCSACLRGDEATVHRCFIDVRTGLAVSV